MYICTTYVPAHCRFCEPSSRLWLVCLQAWLVAGLSDLPCGVKQWKGSRWGEVLSRTWVGFLRQTLQADVGWQLQHCQATDVSPLLAVAAAIAAAAAVAEKETVVAFGDGAAEGDLDDVTMPGMGEGVAGWRKVPGHCYPDVMVGDHASSVEAQEAPAGVGSSQGVAVLVGCPWVAGVEDGLEVEEKSALARASCQGVGELALVVGVLGAACLGSALLQDHWVAPLAGNLCPLAVDAVDQHALLAGDQASELSVKFDHEVRASGGGCVYLHAAGA